MTKEVEYSSNTFFNGTTDVTNTNTYTTIYEYDTKNNPLKNVVGLNKIFISEASLNNVVRSTNSSESTTAGTANPVQPTRVRNYELTYNSNDFLTESKYITTNTSGAVTSSTQFFYD
jgi:nitrate reductase cytochrome c-type subunit